MSKIISKLTPALLLTTAFATSTVANATSYVPLWSEGLCTDTTVNGANREYYNAGASFKWKNYLGDWSDRNALPQGDAAFASVTVLDKDAEQSLELNMTQLVQGWLSGEYDNQGVMLRNAQSGKVYLYSREHNSGTHAPNLKLETSQGTLVLKAAMDTNIRKNTYKCSGDSTVLEANEPVLVYFDLSELPQDLQVWNASLELNTTDVQYGNAELQLFRVAIERPKYGSSSLAVDYPNDFEMKFDSSVYLVESFESQNWVDNWSGLDHEENLAIVTENAEEGFEPYMGKALQVRVLEGERNGLNLTYLFKDKIGKDVEEVYFRYYLRIGESWKTVDNGKLPGIAGTYAGELDEGGWGGRRSTGSNGWSARGFFDLAIEGSNPFKGHIPTGSYFYHADQPGAYGDKFIWDGQHPGVLEKNKWYAIEQYLKVNTPGKNDGVFKSWINGVPSYEKTDLRLRNEGDDHIKIDRIWMNIFHGGKKSIEKTSYAFIDNVVIAQNYIGPTQISQGKPTAGQEANRAPILRDIFPESPSVALDLHDVQEFSASISDPDNHALNIKWLINGEVIAENTETVQVTRSLFNIEKQTIELVVTDSEGKTSRSEWALEDISHKWQEVKASQDTYITTSTYKSRGQDAVIALNESSNGLISFPSTEVNSAEVKSVYLMLTNIEQYGDMLLSAYAAKTGWSEGTGDLSGATREFLDYATSTPWAHFGGDWTDANGVANGSLPYNSTWVMDEDKVSKVIIDVTEIYLNSETQGRVDILLKAEFGKHNFASNQNTEGLSGPSLFVERF